MSAVRTAIVVVALVAGAPACALEAQSHRIWGEVRTTEGERIEGFLRWDRNEAVWADLLDGDKGIPDDERDLLDAAVARGATFRERSIEYGGYRITWDDTRDMLPELSQAGIRFGRIASLTPIGGDTLRVRTRAGEVVDLTGGSTDIGPDMRGLEIDTGSGDVRTLSWPRIAEVVLSPAPAGRTARTGRIHGTVEDREGERWTGWIAWDVDDALLDDTLDGEVDGDPRAIPWSRIVRVERNGFRGATVILDDGSELDMRGTDEVSSGNGGILVSDPEIGSIRVPWDEFEVAEFHAPADDAAGAWEAFDGTSELSGVIELGDGELVSGPLRWDADERWNWEMLDGWVGEVEVDVEFARIRRIEKMGAAGVLVTLRSGRVLELEDSNDVTAANRGLFLRMDDGAWRYVDWYDFWAIDFDDVPAPPEAGR